MIAKYEIPQAFCEYRLDFLGGRAMVLKYIDKKTGCRIHGPAYTKAEEDEFYRRVGRGPITVARPASDRKASERDSDKHKQTTTNNKQS
jgi:hypothetical protein